MGWMTVSIASFAPPKIIVVINVQTIASKAHVRPALQRLTIDSGRQMLT